MKGMSQDERRGFNKYKLNYRPGWYVEHDSALEMRKM